MSWDLKGENPFSKMNSPVTCSVSIIKHLPLSLKLSTPLLGLEEAEPSASPWEWPVKGPVIMLG